MNSDGGGGSPGLYVERMAVRAGHRRVVDEVSFRALTGEVTAVIGPNGAGKTSLFDTVVGLRIAESGAHWIPLREASKAKDDGRLPMTDHNTRIFVVADSGAAARAVAEAIVRDAFHNVAFFDGTPADLRELVAEN